MKLAFIMAIIVFANRVFQGIGIALLATEFKNLLDWNIKSIIPSYALIFIGISAFFEVLIFLYDVSQKREVQDDLHNF